MIEMGFLSGFYRLLNGGFSRVFTSYTSGDSMGKIMKTSELP
jgi:hypothetical protein